MPKKRNNDSEGQSELLKSWLDISALRPEELKLARLLFDEVTELPTVPLLFGEIERVLKERGQLGILCVNVVKYSSVEEIYGWKIFDEIVKRVADALVEVKSEHLREEDILSEVMISGNAFVVLISPPRKKEWVEMVDLDRIRIRLYDVLNAKLKGTLDESLYQKFGCYIGCSVIDYEPLSRLERTVYKGLEEALQDSSLQEAKDAEHRTQELRNIIRTRSVHTVYQPIVDLKEGKTIGFEALSRGPQGEFEFPEKLFKVAYESDLVWRLERLCREQAFANAKDLEANQLLFVNVDPDAIHDPQFRSDETAKKLAVIDLEPDRIVLELTERTAIKDFTIFRHTLEIFRGLGYKIAVDDVGAGYAALQSIAEVQPDYVKIDMSLIRDCDSEMVKQELANTILNFAKRVGIDAIAEGVETQEELHTLRDLGLRYSQGFLFGIPQATLRAGTVEFTKLPRSPRRKIKKPAV